MLRNGFSYHAGRPSACQLSVALALSDRFEPRLLERRVSARAYRLARAGHELAIEVKVVKREETEDEDLPRHEEVAEVSPRVPVAARLARARRVERELVVLPARLLQDDLPAPREGLSVPCVARRQRAIEHVDAVLDGLEQIARRADPHEVTRALRVEPRGDLRERLVHLLDRLAHG